MSLRVLHTADWHLGGRLGGQDRIADQLARVGELMAYAEAHQADVLLVCGDVLDEPRTHRLSDIIRRLGKVLQPSLRRGMQCVFVAGQHDSQNTFELFSGLQSLVGGGQAQVSFVAKPTLLSLTGAGGDRASLVALPYPDAPAYEVATGGLTLQQKQAALKLAVADAAGHLRAQADAEGGPNLLAGHFSVGGPAATEPGDEQVQIDPELFAGFAYVALGRSHQPKVVSDRVRFSGAIERNDFGEMDQPREALLVTVAGEQVPQVTPLPLDPTPMVELEVRSSSELSERAEQIPEVDRALVKLIVRLRAGEPLSPLRLQAEKAFPRLIKPETIIWLDAPVAAVLTGEQHLQDFEPTVKDYLNDQLENDPDRDALLSLADGLLDQPPGAEP